MRPSVSLHLQQAHFHSGHSTESLILSIIDDLRSDVDSNIAAALILFELSAAFDMVDHNVLENRIAAAGRSGMALH